MNPSTLRLFVVLLISLGAATVLPAQLTLSYPSTVTNPASVSGQSFTPGDAGSFPTTSAYLTQMTFQVGNGNVPSGPVYLDIYADSGFSSFVGSSTNSQTWTSGNDQAIETWTFDSLALDKSTTYYAIYSSDDIAGSLETFTTYASDANPYVGGAMIYSGLVTPGYDTSFSATFATTSAVPEPSSYAALAGLAALVLVVWSRIKRTRRTPPVRA